MTSNLKGAVVVNAYWRGGDDGAKNIARALRGLGATVDLLKASEIDLGVGEGLTGSFCYDFVVFLDKDDHLARLLERSGARLFNSAESIRLADDKMLTHIALLPLPQPETISSPLFFAGEDDPSFLDYVEQKLGYPIVVKKCFGAFGREVYLAKNRAELNDFRARFLKEPHLYQKYVECGAADYRVITIGGKAVAAMKRQATEQGEFRANAALGGKGEKVELTEELCAFAEKASALLGLEYAGVDLLWDGEKFLVTEVNSNAHFALITEVTGVPIAELYAKHILSEMAKGGRG